MTTDSLGQQWSWPDEVRSFPEYPYQDSDGTTTPPAPASDTPQATGTAPEPTPSEPPRPRYKPRTCRICLEVVQPSTELDDTLAGRVFASKARVRYVSEDPELGRLMSPCNCKGSQKYVHEGCLQAWRNAAPMSERNYWRCPTCKFEYRMGRLRWSRWLSSKTLRAGITILVMIITVFLLGFIADPIIRYGADPLGTIAGSLLEEFDEEFDLPVQPLVEELEADNWYMHFLKGFLSLGLLGFIKSMLAISPFQIFNMRAGGGRRRRRGGTEGISWFVVLVGVVTFLAATWKAVSHFSAKFLEKLSDRVVDVQGTEPEDDEEDENAEGDGLVPQNGATEESRKDR
ncbi:putative E3 ubiquitin-protein ligase [Triangularia setosa]|uniref:E3 ubiquitin-protein ligase n=1 Tax=Triangularia setosa TaxID=2587417 RepID=A0AAN6WDS7_9PEZI|nr:putative E3 ubiquitin-protein ligase [Podospora setosa]